MWYKINEQIKRQRTPQLGKQNLLTFCQEKKRANLKHNFLKRILKTTTFISVKLDKMNESNKT